MINVLLVEDSKTVQLLMVGKLNDSGINVITTESMSGAKAILEKKHNINYAILDINLPDTQEDEIIDLVNIEYKIPSIVYSGNYNYEKVEEIIQKPIIDFVIKNNNKV